jgi:hypothetical protein
MSTDPYVQAADCDVERVGVDMPVELTFRGIRQGVDVSNDFWKARRAA